MNKLIKKILLLIPKVKKHVNLLSETQIALTKNQQQFNQLNDLIQKSRSPELFNDCQDFLTERLMAHPVSRPMPAIDLSSKGAVKSHNSIAIANRLLKSYHMAIEDEKKSPFKRDGEDLWSKLIRDELPELMDAIDRKDPEKLVSFLLGFGESYVWFGGITTCVDGYNKNQNPQHIALTYLDKIICIAEYLGILQLENPECGPVGENLHVDIEVLINEIENAIGISISPPMEIIHTDGINVGGNVFHYRHINSLYNAIKIARLNTKNGRVCEFGGVLGITAMYANRFGIIDYTILDLPITCLLAGHYLLHALGDNNVCLYGETMSENSIKILPYWECLDIPDKSIDLTINQDRLPEISDNLIAEYLTQIKRITKKHFLSINHEYFYPRTVCNFVKSSGGYEVVSRSKCWVREGYVDEVFRIK
jgi:hypothetical protein